MPPRHLPSLAALTMLAAVLLAGRSVRADRAGADYPDGRELMARLLRVAAQDRAAVHEIGRSANGQKLRLLEIPPCGARADRAAAVLVVANPDGVTPLASIAAVALAESLVAREDGAARSIRWYILPLASPDAFDRGTERPRVQDGRNRGRVDDDRDGVEAEDPPDDLDGDGLVTTMLLTDATGTWVLDATTQVVRPADPARGERGRFLRLPEGRDDDDDGRFNEDGAGGVVIDANLPHRFRPWTDTGGRWPADQPESRALLEFAFAHPQIAQVIVLGAASNLQPVPSERAPAAVDQPVTLPPRPARALGLTPGQAYPLDFVLATARQLRLPEYPPERVRGLLSLGPREYPDPADLAWWRAAADRHLAGLAGAGLGGPRLAPPPPGPGSVVEWAYYQYGVVAFAVDLWTCPLPAAVAADTLVTGVAADTLAADQIALREFAAARGGHGWCPWRAVSLPDGREALVGGPAPLARTTPPYALVDSLLSRQLPLVIDLARWRPVLAGIEVVATPRGADVWEVVAHARNDGPVPYPTAQGALCRRPPPLVLTLAGAEPLDGPPNRTIAALPAGGSAAARWLVRAARGARVSVTAAAPSLGEVVTTIELNSAGGRP